MPSMSYCKFENASNDLGQCLDAMEEAGTIEDLDLNQYEQDAFRAMYDMCKQYVAEYKRLAEEFIDE
jgi:hypothetical protein